MGRDAGRRQVPTPDPTRMTEGGRALRHPPLARKEPHDEPDTRPPRSLRHRRLRRGEHGAPGRDEEDARPAPAAPLCVVRPRAERLPVRPVNGGTVSDYELERHVSDELAW